MAKAKRLADCLWRFGQATTLLSILGGTHLSRLHGKSSQSENPDNHPGNPGSRSVSSGKPSKQSRPSGSRVDLTRGPMLKRLIAIAWPLFVGNILNTFYHLADMYWVARVSTDAVAAVAITFPTVWLTFSFGLGVTIAGVAFVSQLTGAKRPDDAAHMAGQVVIMSALVGVLLGGLGILFRTPILTLLGAEGETLRLASVYLVIVSSALPFNYIYFAYRAVSQGTGDAKTPRNLLVLTTLLSAALDPFFVLGWGFFPEWGVAGAAWATWLAQLLGAVISLAFLMRGRLGVRLQPAHFKPDFQSLRRIASVGIASSLEMGSRGLTSVVIAGIVARFGTVEAAAYGIVMRVMSVVWTSSGAMEQAAASAVGQNLGAGQPVRAEKMAWTGAGVMFLFLSSIAVLLFVFADAIMRFFGVSDDVVQTGVRFIRLHVFSYGFWGAMEVLQGGFRGAGDTLPPALMTFLSRWVVHIPSSIALSYYLGWGADGTWIMMTVSYTLFSLVTAVWFKMGRWKRGVLSTRPKAASGKE